MKKSQIIVPGDKEFANAGDGYLYSNIGADQGGNNAPNQIYMANTARFTEAHFSQPLTAFATGWRDPNNIDDTLEHVSPTVMVPRRFEFAQATNAEEFYTEVDDIRGIGSDFKRVEFTSSKVNSKTLNKGLTIRVDSEQVQEMPNWREVYTGRLMRRLLRNELRRAMTLLLAAGTNTAVTWGGAADPDQDLMTAVLAYGDASGVEPNRVAMGLTGWFKRRSNYRTQNNAGGYASAGMNEEEVAGYLGLERLKVIRERYQSGANAKTRVLAGFAVLYLAEGNQSPEDPSNIKRFVSANDGGGKFRVYEQQINSKLTDITVEHNSLVVVTSTLGVQKLTIS